MSHPLEAERVETKNHDTEQKIELLVPYSGKQGQQLLLKMKKQLKINLPDDITTMISYKRTKLPTKLLVKDKSDVQHKQNVEGCNDDYVGEIKRHIAEESKITTVKITALIY